MLFVHRLQSIVFCKQMTEVYHYHVLYKYIHLQYVIKDNIVVLHIDTFVTERR